jgi:hypothetical protein
MKSKKLAQLLKRKKKPEQEPQPKNVFMARDVTPQEADAFVVDPVDESECVLMNSNMSRLWINTRNNVTLG